MLSHADFKQKIVDSIQDHDILSLYNMRDPLVCQQIEAIAYFFSLLSREIDVAEIEPFIKSRNRSIIADATNKGILPTAIACQHWLEVINKSSNPVTLSQGRLVEDHSGSRAWRLLQSVTVQPGETGQVQVEQSEYREITYIADIRESFHQVEINLNDEMHLADLSIRDVESTPNYYRIAPRWMNVAKDEKAVTVVTDNLRSLIVEFGDSSRVGRTVRIGEQYVFGILETYGEVDISKLKDASLLDVNTIDEQRISVRFKAEGLIRDGANPLSIAQLKVMASYPSLYDANAVFLGNFDYLVRQKFIAKTHFISVWNEAIQEQHYGANWHDINHLHLAVVAKNALEQSSIQQEIQQLIGRADSLYEGRVIIDAVEEKPYLIEITGRLASIHDLDSVKAQITGLLLDKYGKNSVSASRWIKNGFNTQEIIMLLRNNISAFQDRISDFSVVVSSEVNQPHQWVYMTNASITVRLDRTADSIGTASWLM